MKPGIYEDMPFADYLAIDAVNASTLKYFARSPAHAREYMQHPPAPTPAMDFGTAAHVAILEPHRLDDEYIVAPVCDRRTKAGKAVWSGFESMAANRTVMTEIESTKLLSMQIAIDRNTASRELLEAKGKTEVVAIWIDGPTQLLCKARIDLLVHHEPWTVIADLKTTQNASAGQFAKDAINYGYDVQMAFYESGLYTLDPRIRRCVIIAIEKVRPHAVAVYDMEAFAETGRAKMRRFLTAYAKAGDADEWTGYPAGIQQLAIPAWAIDYGESE